MYLGDARELMPRLEEPADLLMMDPPYGRDLEFENRYPSAAAKPQRMVGDEGPDTGFGIVASAIRALRKRRHVYCFGGGVRFLSTLPMLGPVTEIVWDKGRFGPGDLSQAWGASHEIVEFSTKQGEGRRCNEQGKPGAVPARLRRGTVIRVPKPTDAAQANIHTTQKPVALLADLVESSSLRDEVVVDPCFGSGSTLVAAIARGRRAVGVEVREDHFEAAVAWVQQVESWLDGAPLL